MTDRSSTQSRCISVGLVLLIAIVTGGLVAKQAWLVLAGFLGFSLLMIWPAHLWLGVFVLLVPFDGVSALGAAPAGLTLTSLVGLVTLCALIWTGIALHRFRIPARTALCWLAFILWGTSSVLWSADRDVAIERLPTAFSLFIFYLIATSCQFSAKEIAQITRFAIVGGCLAAIVTLYQFHSGIFYRDLNMRASLVFGERQDDPNILAASLLLPLSLVAGEFFSAAKLRDKLFLSFCGLLLVLGVFVTTSRGALTAIAVMVLFYMRKFGMSWRTLLPAGFLGSLLLLTPEFLINRFEQAETSGGAGRVYIWQAGLAAFKDYFIAGAGIDNFPVVYNDYASHASRYVGLNRAAHNVFLQVAVELGSIGFALFIFTAISHLRTASQRDALIAGPERFRLIACEAAACGILVAAIFLGLLWTKAFWAVWMLLAICSRVPRVDYSIESVFHEAETLIEAAQRNGTAASH